jgi:hypothetical protein
MAAQGIENEDTLPILQAKQAYDAEMERRLAAR